jgi:hypothetical protein
MARAGPERAAGADVFPPAASGVDTFPVVKRVPEAGREVGPRLGPGTAPDDPLRREGRLVLGGKERRRAELLKEDCRRRSRDRSVAHARLDLRAWRRSLGALRDRPELRALTGMFERWQEEILNDFTDRVTQGVVEGATNRAKVVERRADGYRTIENVRLHLLLAG